MVNRPVQLRSSRILHKLSEKWTEMIYIYGLHIALFGCLFSYACVDLKYMFCLFVRFDLTKQ